MFYDDTFVQRPGSETVTKPFTQIQRRVLVPEPTHAYSITTHCRPVMSVIAVTPVGCALSPAFPPN